VARGGLQERVRVPLQRRRRFRVPELRADVRNRNVTIDRRLHRSAVSTVGIEQAEPIRLPAASDVTAVSDGTGGVEEWEGALAVGFGSDRAFHDMTPPQAAWWSAAGDRAAESRRRRARSGRAVDGTHEIVRFSN